MSTTKTKRRACNICNGKLPDLIINGGRCNDCKSLMQHLLEVEIGCRAPRDESEINSRVERYAALVANGKRIFE